MTNSSNRHRRRLYIVQNDYDHCEHAIPAASDQTADLPVPEQATLPRQSAAVEPERGSTKTLPQQRGFRVENFQNYFRHIIVVGIVASLGYLYSQYQRADPVSENNNAQVDPFADWENIAEAPAFNSQAISQSQNSIPMPISLTSETGENLPAILDDSSSWIESDKKSIDSEPVLSQKEPLGSSHVSNFKKRSLSLWNEPGTEQNESSNQKIDSIASLTEDSNSTYGIEQKHQNSKKNRKGNNFLSENVIKSQSRSSRDNQRTIPSKPVEIESWRQFTLGSGKQSTVCVIDESVTNDALLLSTIFTGIRREWIRDVARSQEQRLVLLIANQLDIQELPGKSFTASTPSIQKRQIELHQKIDASDPSRIVYLSRGKENRGWLKFSSEQESVAALLSVPGLYRITSQAMVGNVRSNQQKQQIVSIELPAQAQDSTTADLLFTALSGDWNRQVQEGVSGYHASRDASRKTGSHTKKHSEKSRSQKSIVQQDPQKKYLQPDQKKKRVEILPSPFASAQQDEPQHKSKRNNFFKLPPAPVNAGN